MTEDSINAYEGLFLFPQAQAGNLQAAIDHLRDILGRAQAEVIGLRKWDERRLAYEIKGNKRGVYFLVYFRAPGSALTGIERACNLSELMLRSLIIRADHLTQEQMEAADGTAELADEIKLKSAQPAPAGEVSEPGRSDAEADRAQAPTTPKDQTTEPITVETETPAKDAATTFEG